MNKGNATAGKRSCEKISFERCRGHARNFYKPYIPIAFAALPAGRSTKVSHLPTVIACRGHTYREARGVPGLHSARGSNYLQFPEGLPMARPAHGGTAGDSSNESSVSGLSTTMKGVYGAGSVSVLFVGARRRRRPEVE